MKTLKCLLSFCLILLAFQSKADSPLTSTNFAKAYENNKIVKYAAEAGEIDAKIAKFLLNEKKPIAVKAAVANALGWDMNGKKNARIYTVHLRKKYGFGANEFEMEKVSAADLMLLGYLTALDDYFNPSNGLEYLELAAKKNPNSLTIRMMLALVKSQIAFDSDWCQVYQLVAMAAADDSPNPDFSGEAISLIMEYIDLYKDECNK